MRWTASGTRCPKNALLEMLMVATPLLPYTDVVFIVRLLVSPSASEPGFGAEDPVSGLVTSLS